MLLHCTEKLAAKLKSLPAVADDAGDSPLGAWHANLIRLDRVQCVLFCHDETRFCLFMAGLKASEFKELGRCHRELFTAVLQSHGVPETEIKRALLALGPLRIDRATDRSVLGTLNRSALDVELGYLHGVPHVLHADPVEVSRWLNERSVMARKKWLWPERLMAERVSQLGSV